METNFEMFGYEFGDGWLPIMKPIESYIEEYNKDKNEEDKIIIEQAKEKFGGLRVYCNFVTDELRELIEQAEKEASETCELCGSKENVGYTLGWITTCCENCVRNMAQKRQHHLYRWKPFNCDTNIKWYEFCINENKNKLPNYKLKNESQ